MKINPRSFGFKLWSYFILFTALIFTVLWLLQTVFLQGFYNSMLIGNTKNAAQKIIENSTSKDVDDLIDELSHDNSILIYITDTDGNVLFSSDEFKGMHNNINKPHTDEGSKPEGMPEKVKKRAGYRSLPGLYDEFLDTLKASEDDTAEYRTESFYVYGAYINYYNNTDEKSVLYVSTTIDTLGSSVAIISMQLVWVTVLSVVVGFVLSWFIARRFSAPVGMLSEKAKKLGEKEYKNDFRKGFCTELDELSETLDKTNDKLNKSKDFQMELLANVSHDLRTPVTMIKGYAEMIRDISWEDEKQCSEDIAVIIKEADRLTALVNEIMEYSELETKDAIGDFIEVDLSSLVKKTADRFETLNKPENIVIEKSIEKGITVMGSSSHLERALYNLMDNAFRHTGESKKICVSLTAEGETAKIEVKDFGNGIPDSEIENIWERYYTSRMRKGQGVSGLGLAIVRQITELHGGKCYAVSTLGKGSSFIIVLNI